MRRFTWAPVAFLFLSGQVAAAPRPLTLRQAVGLALSKNPSLAGAGAVVSAARARVLGARGLDDPQLTLDTSLERTRRQRVPGVPVQERTFDGVSGGLSVSQPLAIGGRVGLALAGGYQRTGFETETANSLRQRSASEQYTPALELRWDQPLARGFGVSVARAERTRARMGLSAARSEREGLAASVARGVSIAYWSLAHAQRELTIRRASVAAARRQLARTRANTAVGKLPPTASAEIAVALAVRQDAELLASQAAAGYALSLARLCGAPLDAGFQAVDPLPSIDPHPSARRRLDRALALALERSPQLAALRAQAKSQRVEIEVTENGLLPQLDLSLRGGPLANAPTPSAAYEQISGFGSYAVWASLGLALPLGRHAARGAHESARANLRRIELGQAQVRTQITEAVSQSLAQLETARRRSALLLPALEAAQLDLEAERARFEVGRSTNFDVLRRQDALYRIQVLIISAELTAQVATAQLEASTGEIIPRNGAALAASMGRATRKKGIL